MSKLKQELVTTYDLGQKVWVVFFQDVQKQCTSCRGFGYDTLNRTKCATCGHTTPAFKKCGAKGCNLGFYRSVVSNILPRHITEVRFFWAHRHKDQKFEASYVVSGIGHVDAYCLFKTKAAAEKALRLIDLAECANLVAARRSLKELRKYA